MTTVKKSYKTSEKQREYGQQYYKTHHDERREYNRQYYKTHREECLARASRRYRKQPEYYINHAQQWRKNNPERVREQDTRAKRRHRARYPERTHARNVVTHLLAIGKLEPQPCEVCGATPTHAHHDDYSRPLEIRWLCRDCHIAWHKNGQKAREEAA